LGVSPVQRYFVNELRTVSQPTLNIEQLSETKVILPPIEMQLDYAARVTATGKLETDYRHALNELNALFGSLQDRYFRGEL